MARIKVARTANVADDVRRLIHHVNFTETDLPFPAVGSAEAISSGAGLTGYGGIAVDRSVFRQLLPDFRWLVYAAGLVSTDDANTVTLSLRYQKDDTTTVLLGSSTHTGALAKKTLGPFDVFGTAGVPAGETVPVIRLFAQKNTGGNATLASWCLWLRLLASKQ